MDLAPKTLIGIARVSRGVLDMLLKHGGGKTVESFQLEKITVASGAIMETLNKAMLLGRGVVDPRLSDWLAGEEPETCLNILNQMEAFLSPNLERGRGIMMYTFFQSPRRSVSTKDKYNEAIKLFRDHRSYFHFLFSTTVWNHESGLLHKLPQEPLPEVLPTHETGTKLLQQATQHKVEELLTLFDGETGLGNSATQERNRKARRQGFSAKKMDSIVGWLSAWSCKETHGRIFLLRQPDTCTWLPNTNMYKTWRNTENSFLWLHGKPGAGKSVLAASVIDNLERSLQEGDVLAYFYCDFRNERSTSASEVMRSLLSQLLQQFRHCTADPRDLFDELAKQKDEKTLTNARKFACYISRAAKCLYRQPLLVIDALDECNDIEELLGAIEELNRGGIRLFVTSRPLQVIKECFQVLPLINMDMMNYEMSADIRLHVTRELDSHRRLRLLDAFLKNDIHFVLCKKANGMFRWVQCQLNLIKQCTTTVWIRKTLNNLPSSLNETYNRILLRISVDDDQSKVARHTLDWLVVALAPLRLSQILEGLSIDPAAGVWDRDSAPVHGPALLDVLGSLVSYNEVTDIVILSHFSVKEYLTARLTSGRPPIYYVDEQAAHTQLALLCMSYIGIYLKQNHRPRGDKVSSRNFHKTGRILDDSQMATRSTKCPRPEPPSFVFHSIEEYVLVWGFRHLAHINPRNRVVLRAIETLCLNADDHPLEWNQLCERHYLGGPSLLPTLEHDIMLYILIVFAPEPLLRLYLGHSKLELKDGTNPLIYAASRGKIEHARTLLLRGVELDSLALEAAANSGKCDLVDLFLAEGSPVHDKIFVSVLKSDYNGVPIRIMARLVQTDQFAEWAINTQDEDLLLRVLDLTRYLPFDSDKSPSEQDFGIIERRLVQLSYNPSARFNEKSLRHAVSAGHVSAVQQMLSLDIPFPSDIILDASCSTVSNGEMMRLCIDMGADIRQVSPTGDTPLHLALTPQYYPFGQDIKDITSDNVKALIDAGCDPSRSNLAGETPLHLALTRGYISIVEDLLPSCIPLPPDILLAASRSHSSSTIQLLISKGANVQVIAANGDTPLHRLQSTPRWSQPEDCLDCVKAFINAGCDPSLPNASGKTPFELAAENGNLLVMQYLHGTLSSPFLPDILLSAVGKYCSQKTSTIRFLINKGARIHVSRPSGDTLLHLVMTTDFNLDMECLNNTKILVDAGCNPVARNLAGATPFHMAARMGHISVMEYLLSLGAVSVPPDIMITQLEGKSKRGYYYGQHSVVRFLLDVGGDVHTVAENGDNLLHLAAKLRQEEGALELAKHLVHAGCISESSALNSLQETPLHVAARSGFISVVKYLLSLDIQLPHDILLAASAGPSDKTRLVQYLVQEGASVSVVTKNKDTPLHLLLLDGEEDDRLECVQTLIGAGCDPRAENLARETPLHVAARRKSSKIMEYLLSQAVPLPPNILLSASTTTTLRFLLNKGLDLCAVPVEGVTELMHRVLSGDSREKESVEFAKILINAGWDPLLKNSIGETIIHVAMRNGDLDAVKFFLSQHVPLPSDILLSAVAPTQSDWWAYKWRYTVALTRFLVGEGISVNVTTPNGDTPLHLVLMRVFEEDDEPYPQWWWRLVEILLDSGSDPSSRNVDGKTPFDLAETKGHFFYENFKRLVRNSRMHRLNS